MSEYSSDSADSDFFGYEALRKRQESRELNEESNQTVVNKSYSSETSAKSLTKEETEEHCIPDSESVESVEENRSDPKIHTLSDTDSNSQLWGENLDNEWRYELSFDENWIPDNYMPPVIQDWIPKRQTNNWNEINAEVIDDWYSSDCNPYLVGSADLMKSDEVQENRKLNEESSEAVVSRHGRKRSRSGRRRRRH